MDLKRKLQDLFQIPENKLWDYLKGMQQAEENPENHLILL